MQWLCHLRCIACQNRRHNFATLNVFHPTWGRLQDTRLKKKTPSATETKKGAYTNATRKKNKCDSTKASFPGGKNQQTSRTILNSLPAMHRPQPFVCVCVCVHNRSCAHHAKVKEKVFFFVQCTVISFPAIVSTNKNRR